MAAGLLQSELDEAHELFGRALAELGHQRERDWRAGGEPLAREYARRGLDGRMPLVEAVSGVYKLSLYFEREDWSLDGMSMTSLLVLADEWEDEPTKRPEIEQDMRRELERFLERQR